MPTNSEITKINISNNIFGLCFGFRHQILLSTFKTADSTLMLFSNMIWCHWLDWGHHVLLSLQLTTSEFCNYILTVEGQLRSLTLRCCDQIQKIGWKSKPNRENLRILQKLKLYPYDGCHFQITHQVTKAYLYGYQCKNNSTKDGITLYSFRIFTGLAKIDLSHKVQNKDEIREPHLQN